MSEHRSPSRKAISRDTVSFLGGWYLTIYQAQFATTFNLSVFLGGLAIVGVPGAMAVWSGRPGGSTPTGPSSSDSAQAPSSEASSS